MFDPVSERILRIRLKNPTPVSCPSFAAYAPTNVPGNEEETEAFYQSLQSVVEQVPARDMLLIMGDLNARVGNDTTAWRGTLGRFGLAEQKENGVKLLDFCALDGLVVTNTLFQHRACHQHTWFHPAESSRAGHMLDYVLLSQRFKSSILDTRVYRKTHLQSDHRLVISKVRLKLKAKRRRVQREPTYQVDPHCLEDQQVEEFRRVLAGELEANPTGDVEEDWCTFKDSLKKAQCCLPLAIENEESDWVTDEVREVSRKKQEAWMRCVKSPDNVSLK